MKNTLVILLLTLASLMLTTCKKDAPYLVTYSKSFPIFGQAQVAETLITYGDTINLSVAVSDKTTPLSTLEVQVVVNNDVVTTESIRTKGNESSITRQYKIPFVGNRPDNAIVKVYLSSINVDGWTTDTILATTSAKRPVINSIWIVPVALGGTTYKLTLTDSANLLYNIKGMNYGQEVGYYLATKITKFKRVDWSGMVFGKVGDGIGLISDPADSITSSDASLVGISEVTFDALKFTIIATGKLLQPITSLNLNTDLNPLSLGGINFIGGNVYFGEGVKIAFTGFTDLHNQLSPDYFNIIGTDTAVFLGKTGVYKVYYYSPGAYMYLDPQPAAIYPDVLWMCGTGFGRPSSPYVTTSSWNWNTPLDYAPCRLVSPNVFQVTVYGSNSLDAGSGFGTFDFKFFSQRGWFDASGNNNEIDASTYTITPSSFTGRTDPGNVGNVNGGSATFSGVYQITVDMNLKTINLVKLN